MRRFISIIMMTFFLNVVAQNTPPVLTNFRVENNQPSRIYFDSSMPISGTSTTGFTVSGKTISGVNIASNTTSGHYFTISSPFNFWDNNTIHYEGGSDIIDLNGNSLDEFTLEYIKNDIPEPSSSNNIYYVASSGSDSNTGTSINSPLLTIQRAINMATAGSIIYVKAGIYKTSGSILLPSGGTISKPIKIIGYKSIPNDINSMYYSFNSGSVAPALNSNEMPLIDGMGGTFSGIYGDKGDNFIIIRNIQVQNCGYGIRSNFSTGLIIDNCVIKNIDDESGGTSDGSGIELNIISGTGSKYIPSLYRVINSISINSNMGNVVLYGNNNLVNNVKTYCDGTSKRDTDYYITLRGSDNILRNSFAERMNATVDTGHGIGIKSGEGYTFTDSYFNLIELNYSKGHYENYYARNSKANYNVFKDNESTGFGAGKQNYIATVNGFVFMCDVNNNIVERMNFYNLQYAFAFHNVPEVYSNNGIVQNNIIRNSVVNNVYGIMRVDNSSNDPFFEVKNNIIVNCTFNNLGRFYYSNDDAGSSLSLIGNEYVNCLFNNVASVGASYNGITFNYNNFWNSWVSIIGSNSGNVNPQFDANLIPTNLALKKGITLSKNKYDKNKKKRSSTSPTLGAYEIQDKTTGSVNANAGKDVSICAGSSTVLTASGGSSYTWSNGASGKSITVSPDKTTTYTVTVSEGSITGTDEVVVTVNSLPMASAGADVSIEAGQSTTLTASGGDAYVWSTGETTSTITVNPTTSTIYEVKVSKNGCESTATVTVTVNNTQPVTGLTADAGKDVTICAGNSAVLNASGGSGYTWSNGASGKTITVSPDKTMSYTVTVTDGTNTATDEVLVIVNPLPVASAGSDVTIEAGQSTTLTASGGDSYVWSTGETSTSINVIPATTTIYEVKVTKNGCESTASVKVTVNSAPSIPVVNADAGNDITICKGSSAVLTASGGSSYIWSKGERTKSIMVSPDVTTTYAVTVSNGIVSQTDNVTVFVKELPVADAGADITIEEGQSTTLSASGGDTYLWSTGETTKSITVSPKASTSYSVKVFQNGCESTDKVQVTVKEVPPAAANAGSDITICKGESITLKGDGGTTYSWSTGAASQNITVNPTRTTTYTLTANRGGTTNSDEVTVTVINCDLNNGVNNSVSGTTGNPATNDTAEQDDSQILNKADFELTVYPNPTEGKLNVQTTIPIYNFNLVLMNINGNIIYTDEMDANEDGINKEIDLSRMAKGVYFLQLYNEEKSYVKKIMVI